MAYGEVGQTEVGRFSELALRKVETLEEAVTLIEDLRDYAREALVRHAEEKRQAVREEAEVVRQIEGIGVALDDIGDELVSLRSQRQFLTQTLVAILAYGGGDPTVPQDLAAIAVRDFLPEVEYEDDFEDDLDFEDEL